MAHGIADQITKLAEEGVSTEDYNLKGLMDYFSSMQLIF